MQPQQAAIELAKQVAEAPPDGFPSWVWALVPLATILVTLIAHLRKQGFFAAVECPNQRRVDELSKWMAESIEQERQSEIIELRKELDELKRSHHSGGE